VVSLFPSVTSSIGFTIDVPADCPAGDYLLVVRIVSTIDAERQTVHDLWLNVAPVVAFSVELRPRKITSGSKASIQATITNDGNADAPVFVSALDRTREADCVVTPPEVVVPTGASALVGIDMRGPRPWFGQAPLRTIVITAVCDGAEVEELATFTQKPRIPRGVVTFFILAGIIALWATIFLLVVAALGRSEDPGKATATEFANGGEQNVSLTTIAGTAEGVVTASTTGEGIPRITVEAFRVQTSGEFVPSGSAATDDDGAYSLSSLIPGSYALRFSAEGYDDLWYPAGTSPEEAGPVAVGPTDTVGGLDMVLSGEPGALVGVIAVPESGQSVPVLTVTATLVDSIPDGELDEEGAAVFTQQTGSDIRLDGLPTPGTYRIRIEGADFEPQIFEETLQGGEIKVLNTVRLGAALGSISGRVVDADGQPLGNVTVNVSDGDDVREITTPTSGNVGEFSVVGLETPNTYVLTFELEGYTSQTIALDVLAGENRTGITALLIGGIGTVEGTVRNAEGVPLGDVQVTVTGKSFTATTTTLTTGTDGAGVGSYSVSSLPVPGTYTVTFDADEFVSETLEVGFIVAGPQAGIDVVLLSASSEVSGIVTGGGEPLGDVLVELSNGTRLRLVATATVPPGTFRFSGVEPGTYTLRSVAPGFDDLVVLVRIAEGSRVERNIDLGPGG
jgi:hypothetical protein